MTLLGLTALLLVLGATSLADTWWRRASRFCLLGVSFYCTWSLIDAGAEMMGWGLG